MTKKPRKKRVKLRPLTEKQELFVQHYLNDPNATNAARLAGYSDPAYGRQLITLPNVAVAIDKVRQRRAARLKLTADEILENLAGIARGEVSMKQETASGMLTVAPTYSERIRALELVAKHLGMFTEKVEHSGETVITIKRE